MPITTQKKHKCRVYLREVCYHMNMNSFSVTCTPHFSHPVSKHKDGDGQNTQLNATEYHQPASRWLHPSFYIVLWVQPYVWHFKRPDIDGIINYCFKFLEIVTHCYLVTIYHRWTVCCTTSLFSSYSGIFWLE